MAYTTKDPCPPVAFSVPNRNKNLEEDGGGEKVSMLTHSTPQGGVGFVFNV